MSLLGFDFGNLCCMLWYIPLSLQQATAYSQTSAVRKYTGLHTEGPSVLWSYQNCKL